MASTDESEEDERVPTPGSATSTSTNSCIMAPNEEIFNFGGAQEETPAPEDGDMEELSGGIEVINLSEDPTDLLDANGAADVASQEEDWQQYEV